MLIKQLDITHYPPGRVPYYSTEVADPEWQTIAEAIRRLDRDEWPQVWLHTKVPIQDGSPDNTFSVLGGRGEYHLSNWFPDDWIYYWDPFRSSSIVEVWESDQGMEAAESALCNDIERVLAIVRYFAETGELSPDEYWIRDDEIVHEPGNP